MAAVTVLNIRENQPGPPAGCSGGWEVLVPRGPHLLHPRGEQAGHSGVQPGAVPRTPASPGSALAVSPSSPHPPALPQPTHPLATWACSKCGLREHRAKHLPCGERPTPWPPGRGLEVQKKGARASLKRLMREPWAPESLCFSALEEGGPGVLAGQAQQLW